MSDIAIPWGSFMTPEDLDRWIDGDDDRRDQAWEDHGNGQAKKWLIVAVEPDQSIFIATDEIKSKTYPVGEEDWGEGVAKDIKEWVLGCFNDYTGLNGELIPRVAIDFDLDEEGCICEITGFGILAHVAGSDVITTWCANFDGFDDGDGGDGWWLEFGYDGAE